MVPKSPNLLALAMWGNSTEVVPGSLQKKNANYTPRRVSV
jgi:hypothetical protein